MFPRGASTQPCDTRSSQTYGTLNQARVHSSASSREHRNSDTSRHNPPLQETFSFVLKHVAPSTATSRNIAVLSTISTVLYKTSLFLPGISVKLIVDAVSVPDLSAPARRYRALLGILVYFAGRLGAAVFSSLQDITYESLSQEIRHHFGANMYDHALSLGVAYHSRSSSGELVDIISRGMDALSRILRVIILQLAPTLIEVIVISAIFIRIGTKLVAFTTLLSCAFYVWVTRLATKWRIVTQREISQAQRSISSRAVEAFACFETIKLFASEERETVLYDELRHNLQDTSVRSRWLLCALSFVQNIIMGVGLVVGMLLTVRDSKFLEAPLEATMIGQADIIYGKLSAGDFMLVYSYMAKLYSPLVWMGSTWGEAVSSLTDLEAVMHLAELSPEDTHELDKYELPRTAERHANQEAPEIEFKNVTFLHENETHSSRSDSHSLTECERTHLPGVQNVSFRLPAGRTLALVGPTGSGKSTIGRLLLRFYEPQAGQILIDGVPARGYKLESLRQGIGVVSQGTTLFDDTLRYNIRYGNPEADDGQVWRAVRASQMGTYVQDQPLGLETMTGANGVCLSGGERQRIGIARCICKNPTVVLLDEATSALDSHTESEVQSQLRELFRDRTTIVIAHRLSTIRHADEIVVLRPCYRSTETSIAERGTHHDLLQSGGIYRQMWEDQTKIADDDAIEEAT